jgi:plastocyanin
MKWLAAVAVLVAALATAALPAPAADDETSVAQDFAFAPPSVTIDPGDTVTFGNAGGTHNFEFADQAVPAAPTDSGDPVWDTPLTRTFSAPGTYEFHCGLHGFMTGRVVVRDPSATPTPTATPDPGGTQPAALAIRTLRVRGRAFCSTRSRACRRPGVALRIDLTAAAHVRGTLRRGRRRAGKINLGTVAAGPRTVRIGRRLKPGRYTLRVRVGNLPQRTLRFRIRPSGKGLKSR